MKIKTFSVRLLAFFFILSQNAASAQEPSALGRLPRFAFSIETLAIDKDGTTQFKKDNRFLQSFSDGRAVFYDQSSHNSGYLDKRGNIAIAPDFSKANPFSEGLATAVRQSKWVVIDQAGTIVTSTEPKDFSSLGNFSEGLCLAAVKCESKHYPKSETTNAKVTDRDGYVIVPQTYGFIDKFGKVIIPPRFDSAESFFEGLARVTVNEKNGFVDKKGNQVVAPTFDDAHKFSESLAAAKKGQLWGFIDKTGQFVIQPQYSNVRDFREGLAAVAIEGKWGFIDKLNKLAIPATLDAVSDDFNDGLAACAIDFSALAKIPGFTRNEKSNMKRFADREDEQTQPYKLERYFPKDLRWGLISRDGTFVVKPSFDEVGPATKDGLRRVRSMSQSGYLNNEGKVVIPLKFAQAGNFSDGLAIVSLADDKMSSFLRASQIGPKDVSGLITEPQLIQKDLEVCDQALRLDSSNLQALFDRAYFLGELERFPESIDSYTKLLTLYPDIKYAIRYRGEAYIKSKKFREAEADFTTAINKDPKNASLYHRRGVVRTALKDYKGALSDLNMALKLHEYPDYYQARSIVYEALGNMELAEKDAIAGGDNEHDAISHTKLQTFDELQKDFDNKRNAFIATQRTPREYSRFRRWKAAKETLKVLDRLIEEANDEQRISKRDELMNYNLQLCRELVKLANPTNKKAVQDAYTRLCIALLSKCPVEPPKNWSTILSYLNEAIKLAKQHELIDLHATTLMRFGRILEQRDDFEGANAKFQEALSLKDDSRPIFSFFQGERRRIYSDFLKRHGHMSEAIAELGKVTLNDPTEFVSKHLQRPPLPPPNCTAQQYYDLAITCKGAGLVTPARDYIEKAIAQSKDKELTRKAEIFLKHRLPKHEVSLLVNAKHEHAHMCESMVRLDAAEKYYRECIKDDPKFEYPYFCLARVLRTQGRLKEAKLIVDEVIALNPDYFGGWMELAMYEAASKNKDAAKAALKKALELDPDDENAKLELSKLGN